MKNNKRRPKVGHVVSTRKRTPPNTSSRRNRFLFLFIIMFLAFVVGAAFFGKLPFALLGLYFVTSMVAFVAYALDKSAARNDKWRTPESSLHFYALIGGWPGALAAQQLLRHKTRKRSFQVVFWATVALNCSAFGWLLSSSGSEVLRAILDRVNI